MSAPSIPRTAPTDVKATYGRVLDLADAVAALRVAAQSETHALDLPASAVGKLIEAHQALLAAHREIEKALLRTPTA